MPNKLKVAREGQGAIMEIKKVGDLLDRDVILGNSDPNNLRYELFRIRGLDLVQLVSRDEVIIVTSTYDRRNIGIHTRNKGLAYLGGPHAESPKHLEYDPACQEDAQIYNAFNEDLERAENLLRQIGVMK